MTGDLAGVRVFLSASFPSGPRGERYRPFDPAEIADAVTAVARALFVARASLVFGGHPTITPLILFVASEQQVRGQVLIYQSAWFGRAVPAETFRLEQLGYGRIEWTEVQEDLAGSLRHMRVRMVTESRPEAGIFVGGMEGIEEEWRLLGELRPRVPRLRLAAPGGAAAALALQEIPVHLSRMLDSNRYPVVADQIVRYLRDRATR